MKSKKLILLCLSVLMILGIVGGFCLTVNAATSGDFKYINDNGFIYITGYTGSNSNITIPSKVNGMKVRGIYEDAFKNNKNLKKVVIEEGIESLWMNAFNGCENLESISIPNSVDSIGIQAFYKCKNLKSIVIPDSVEDIGEQAFAYCENLEELVIGNKVTEIEERAFANCQSLKSITIPDSVQYVEDALFEDCKNLKKVVFSKNLKNISKNMFYGCNLKNITIPDSVTSIDELAFADCKNLENVILPKNLKVINECVFASCKSLKSITIGNNVEKICDCVFEEIEKLDCVNYKGTIVQWKKIKIDFEGNSCLKKTDIHCTDGKIEYVNPTSFWYEKTGRQFVELKWNKVSKATGYEIQLATDKKFTKDKKTINIKKQAQIKTLVKNLKANTKYYMRGRVYKSQVVNKKTINSYSDWSEVTIVELLKKKSNNKVSGNYEYSIGKNNAVTITAYTGNETKLIIPSKLGGKKVTKIGYEAFRECESIKSVKIPKGITSIEVGAFYGCINLNSISIPKGVTEIGDSILGKTAYFNNKKNWKNGAMYISDYLIDATKVKGSYTIKKGTKVVAERAFGRNTKLTKITIPNSVVYMGYGVFLGCEKIKNVTIPNSVKYVGESLFDECENLKSVKVSDSVKKIPGAMFGRCPSLEKVTLPKNVTELCGWAFISCESLESLTVPKSLKKIDIGAIPFNVADIYYNGTKAQWKKIKIDTDNERLTTNNTAVYCKDGIFNTKAPRATTIKSVAKASKSVKVTWAKVSNVKGYEIQVATDSKFTKNVKTVSVKKQSTTSTTVKKLKAHKKYYVHVRTYTVSKIYEENMKIPSSWSKVKNVTTK